MSATCVTLVATLVNRVEAASLERARRKPPEDLAAYDCYLLGKDYHHRRTLEDSTRAIEMFERAVAIDPAYVLARAWLACALVQRNHFAPDSTLFTRSFDEIQKAYALDDGESEVTVSLPLSTSVEAARAGGVPPGSGARSQPQRRPDRVPDGRSRHVPRPTRGR